MTYYCSQCNFSSQFESALLMHKQLHHEGTCPSSYPIVDPPGRRKEKVHTVPLVAENSLLNSKADKGMKLPGRSLSATRLFDRLRARICRSRTLFSHPEENSENENDLSIASECTSKAFKEESPILSKTSALTVKVARKESFGCHLCSFETDRITVLDRHLLNHHKIGMENLLKLVMAKTKDGLSDDATTDMFGLRQPYYRHLDELDEGAFIAEPDSLKIKILKHASTNTDTIDLRDNCNMITNELEKLINGPAASDKSQLLQKMQTLNECMSKFVDSSNILKKVLTKEFDAKSLRNDRAGAEQFFDLRLGDHNSPRGWEKAHSEKMERCRNKHGDNRGDKIKLNSESFYF